jgi:FkbM family methyltransferase
VAFIGAYRNEINANLGNWWTDNYDEWRFGPQPVDIKTAGTEQQERDAALAGVTPHLRLWERLYKQLADDESRFWLVKMLAYRALGYRRVKLPLSTPDYWRRIEAIAGCADASDAISVDGIVLKRMNLTPLSCPIILYAHPQHIHAQFVLQQYRCVYPGGSIFVRPGDHVVDAGACWGDSTLNFAFYAGTEGRVYAIEFWPANLAVLERNLALNPLLSKRVHEIATALWHTSGDTVTSFGGGPGAGIVDNMGINRFASTMTLDDLDLPRVDFLKADVEGSELAVLIGAKATIRRNRPRLAISAYHRPFDMLSLPAFLDELDVGYRFYLRHFSIHNEETVLFAAA